MNSTKLMIIPVLVALATMTGLSTPVFASDGGVNISTLYSDDVVQTSLAVEGERLSDGVLNLNAVGQTFYAIDLSLVGPDFQTVECVDDFFGCQWFQTNQGFLILDESIVNPIVDVHPVLDVIFVAQDIAIITEQEYNDLMGTPSEEPVEVVESKNKHCNGEKSNPGSEVVKAKNKHCN